MGRFLPVGTVSFWPEAVSLLRLAPRGRFQPSADGVD